MENIFRILKYKRQAILKGGKDMKYPSKSHTITLEEMGAHKIPCFIPNIRPLIDQIYLKNEWNV